MYRVTTGEARTDLYGQGKGLAQVIDTSITEDAINAKKKMDFERQQAAEKQKAAREAEVMGNLALLGKVAVRPNDINYFAGKQKELYDFVENNVDKLRSGDASATMQYQRMLGGIQTEAEMSKNAREYAEQLGAEYQKNKDQYRDSSFESLTKFIASPEMAGNWDTSAVTLAPKIDYMARVKGVLAPIANSAAQDPSGRRKVFGQEDADAMIEADLRDPVIYGQIAENLAKTSDADLAKLGLNRQTDPFTYAKKMYSSFLIRNDALAPKTTGDGGSKSNKEILTTTTVTNTNDPDNNWTSEIRYKDGKNLPYQRIVRSDGGSKYGQDVIVDKIIKKGGKVTIQVSAKPDKDGLAEVFEIPYDASDNNSPGVVLLNSLGITNPMALYNKKQPDVTPSKIAGTENKKYSEPKKGAKNETKGGKPTLNTGKKPSLFEKK